MPGVGILLFDFYCGGFDIGDVKYLKCSNCNGTFMYIDSFKCSRSLIIKDIIFYDKNIPGIIFVFICRCCENKVILDWDDESIIVTQNYGTSKTSQVIVYPKKNSVKGT